jgi:hypothetical protein
MHPLSLVPGAARHRLVVRCRPGIVTNSAFGTAPDLRRITSLSLVLRRVRGKQSKRFSDGAEANQRVIGAAVGLAPHIGDGEAQIDEVMAGQSQRRIVERLQ